MKRGVDPRRPALGSMDWFRKRLVASTEALSNGSLETAHRFQEVGIPVRSSAYSRTFGSAAAQTRSRAAASNRRPALHTFLTNQEAAFVDRTASCRFQLGAHGWAAFQGFLPHSDLAFYGNESLLGMAPTRGRGAPGGACIATLGLGRLSLHHPSTSPPSLPTQCWSRGGLRAFSPRVALASACLRGPQRTPFVAKPLAIITW